MKSCIAHWKKSCNKSCSQWGNSFPSSFLFVLQCSHSHTMVARWLPQPVDLSQPKNQFSSFVLTDSELVFGVVVTSKLKTVIRFYRSKVTYVLMVCFSVPCGLIHTISSCFPILAHHDWLESFQTSTKKSEYQILSCVIIIYYWTDVFIIDNLRVSAGSEKVGGKKTNK